jgi:D-alanyl-D-alanine carboxypeptidase (penicillin-binding protein 5/6)
MKYPALMLVLLLVLESLVQPMPVYAENSAAYLLMEAGTGSVLAESNADTRLPIGSLAKLMTAYLTALAIENGDLMEETLLTAGSSVTGTQGAVIWLEQGDTISVSELLLGLLVGNANDAAIVLAEAVSGDIASFVNDMNAAAFDLGMRDTRFTSPQGSDDPEAYSTARDLGILASAVLEKESLQVPLTTWRIFIREESVELVNENTLTRTLEGCRGLKAAHSETAGQCLIAAAEQDGMVCVAVVLGCEDEDERFTEAKKLLNTGFQSFTVTVPGFSEEFLMPLRVKGGTESAVLLELSGLPALAVPVGAEDLQTVLVLPSYREAPLKKGEKVGAVCFYNGKTLLCETDLLAAQDVPEITFGYAIRKMLYILFT